MEQSDSSHSYHIRLFSIKLLFSIVTFGAALYGFATIAHEVFRQNEDLFDQRAFQYIGQHITGPWIKVMQVATFFGKPVFLVPAYLLLILIAYFREKPLRAWEIFITGATSTILLFSLKHIFRRNRPDAPLFRHLEGYSFPSGHALLTFVFCSLLVYLVWRTSWSLWIQWLFSIFLILFSMLVGISRIVLRAHYPTDVLAGFILGYAWVLASLWIQHRYLIKRSTHQKALAVAREW